jgi:hypothetical protein
VELAVGREKDAERRVAEKLGAQGYEAPQGH